MTHRPTPSDGVPCWADLWTSDVEGSRRFYGEVFGWEAEEPQAQFGGYFSFYLNGTRVAGAMGDMGDTKANNQWKMYLATYDIDRTLKTAEAEGAQIVSSAMPVADLGTQANLIDPTGAPFGVWQPGTHPGFTTIEEHGSPSWFELQSRDHGRSVSFYRTVFGWDTFNVSDTDDFRYTVSELSGIADASRSLPDGAQSEWSVYWEVDDAESTAGKVTGLGGSVVAAPEATPYGVLAVMKDPAGAVFKLRTSPKS